MSTPALTLTSDANFSAIVSAFRGCPGRSLPIVDEEGKLLGLFFRQ